ncbi:MAG TPA: deoxyribonuclease IV [Acidobacteriaceae bacterium]
MTEPVAPSTRPRIGVHLSTAGGVFRAAERAHEIGANTFQIFSSSPRMWRQPKIAANHCAQMRELRERFDTSPLVIHASYLINVAAQSDTVWKNSIAALRGEVDRGLALGAEYLVLHPGSWRGLTREAGLLRAAEAIARALDGLAWQECDFRVLIENTAGAEFSLGSNFEQVGELVEHLRRVAPVGACLDTCHCHVSGYDIVTSSGYEQTVRQIEDLIGFETVRVWHMNDAKAPQGSKLDRHEHIGEGTIGVAAFRRVLNDARFRHCAFIAETPVDDPGDDARNVNVLKSLVGRPAAAK